MSSGWEKSVKGATKIKLAAPKSKYIEHILIATHTGEAGVAEVFRALQNRLRDSTWTIVFKSLIVVHLMMREGQQDVTLKYLSSSPHRKLAINNFTEVQTQGRNIRSYADYLTQRAVSYGSTKVDYVRAGEGRFKTLNVEKGLLRETESVQEQIKALIRCDFLTNEPENEITLTSFRLLTMDLLALFHVMNEGTINVLERFFEMSKPDAERALKIYRTFVKQTDQVVRYLSIARHYEHATRLEIPKIKHAPTSLSESLGEYVKDPDFEINRRQYLAQQESKKNGKPVNGAAKLLANKSATTKASTTQSFPSPKASQAVAGKPPTKGPDLIDFFSSIEQNQQPMAQGTYQQPQFNPQMGLQQTGYQQQAPFGAQPTGMPQQFGAPPGQSTNPFLQMQQQQQQQQTIQPPPQQQQIQSMPPQQTQQQQIQPNFTGAGFGVYTAQPQQRFTPLGSIPQSSVATFSSPPQQPFLTGTTDTSSAPSMNPFRQSMMMTGASTASYGSGGTTPLSSQPTSTNPFAKSTPPPGQQNPMYPSSSPFSQPPSSSPFSAMSPGVQQQNSLAPQAAGANTNPFAKTPNFQQPSQSPFSQTPVMTHATGSTNPFRQSAFVNQSTGMGWQSSGQQSTIGGISSDHVETRPIFPRPGMG